VNNLNSRVKFALEFSPLRCIIWNVCWPHDEYEFTQKMQTSVEYAWACNLWINISMVQGRQLIATSLTVLCCSQHKTLMYNTFDLNATVATSWSYDRMIIVSTGTGNSNCQRDALAGLIVISPPEVDFTGSRLPFCYSANGRHNKLWVEGGHLHVEHKKVSPTRIDRGDCRRWAH